MRRSGRHRHGFRRRSNSVSLARQTHQSCPGCRARSRARSNPSRAPQWFAKRQACLFCEQTSRAIDLQAETSLICRVPEVMLPLLLLPKPLFVLLTMLSRLFLSCFALLSCCAGGICQYPQMRNAALSTQKAADYLSQKALGSVFGGVDILIGLVEKTGEAFSRLTPTHAVVTCVFLLGSFSLVAGFLTVHRGQTIQLGSDALEAEHRANESRDRHDVRSSGSCTSP